MTDLNQNTETNVDNVDNVEPMKAEFTPDDLRVELDKLTNKLRVSEIEVERERKRADDYLEKNQKVTAGIFALIEPEILSAFTSMLEEAMDDAFTSSRSFESAVEDVVRNTVDDMDFLDDDAINDRITEAISDSQFDTAVRDVVREMINDGDIRLTFDSV
tara:strand:+ start:373 stop:852 length:480 start_codon:yes stop_codon:yes gene_type:complete